MKRWPIVLATLVLCSSGCGGSSRSTATTGAGGWPCDDAGFLADRAADASGGGGADREVTVCGTVARVRRERDTRSGEHGYFDLAVAPAVTIEIVCNVDEMNAPAWPWVRAGDRVSVRGRYYYDGAYRQGIDWTHHGTSRSWPDAGYVVVNGTEYQ